MIVRTMYPFWAALVSAAIAQILKPLIYKAVHHEWHWKKVFDSGGFPSSHSAMVCALAMAVGIQERFSSTIFAVTLTIALIVSYDAANVRYYSGQNIQITQQLIKDIQDQQKITLDNPIYKAKIKDVLGHKWIEVIGGAVLGVLIALIMHTGL